MIDLKAIRAAAEAATPGPWWHGELNPADGHALAWLGQSFVDCAGGHRNYVDPALDAAYIATANPAAILELMDRLEAAEKALAQPAVEPTCKPALQVHKPTGWVAHRDQYTVPVLFNPYTGEPRDVRDVQSDPQGVLIVPPGKVDMIAASPPPPAEPAVEPMRKHVEDFAAKGGWTKGSGEGAFEFVQRVSYAQGVEDGRNRPAQTPPAEPARTSQDVCTVPLLSDDEWKALGYLTEFDRWRAKVTEAAVRRKAGL